jgi:hypothetical protein
VRAYAYDLLNFLRFLAGRGARLADVVAMDLFDYLDWQQRPASTAGQAVVRLGAGRGAMPATMNRRIAAVRGLFEFAVMTGVRAENPVPAARRSTGLYIASSLRDADDIQIPTGVKLIATWWIFFVLASLLAFALGFSLRRSTSNPVLTMNGSILFGCLYVLDTAVCALGSLIVIRILQSDFGISKSKKSNLVAYAYGSSGAAGKSAAP